MTSIDICLNRTASPLPSDERPSSPPGNNVSLFSSRRPAHIKTRSLGKPERGASSTVL
ncbi:hypothetical protein E4U28_006274, partial [Claviceps purpurea]